MARTRLRQIAIVVRDIEAVVADLQAVFGLEVGYEEEAMPAGPIGMQNRLLPVGMQFIELVSPVRHGVTGERYLERRGGDGGYMVICQTDDRAGRDERIRQFGVRVVGGRDAAAYSFKQFHPKDTGGSFLEVDWHDGYDDMAPPWTHAAGGDWARAVRTHIVDRITAAEIQAPDPAVVAERWSELLGVAAGQSMEGAPIIPLDGADLRFVEDRDGRGEGLGGMDLHAVDRPRALEAAAARGLRGAGNVMSIGGMRFTLVD